MIPTHLVPGDPLAVEQAGHRCVLWKLDRDALLAIRQEAARVAEGRERDAHSHSDKAKCSMMTAESAVAILHSASIHANSSFSAS